ncbi:MAG: hypothetical protein WBG41_12240 [Acidimicrobiales bacterium]
MTTWPASPASGVTALRTGDGPDADGFGADGVPVAGPVTLDVGAPDRPEFCWATPTLPAELFGLLAPERFTSGEFERVATTA